MKPALPADMEQISHALCKTYFPLKCKLWKSRADAAWHIQTPGWPHEHSRSCKTHGETKAIRLLATEAWYEWSVLEGKEFADAGVDGLMTLEDLWAT
jgi:hypothetical protein